MPDRGYNKCLTCEKEFTSPFGLDAFGQVGESQCYDCFFVVDPNEGMTKEEWLKFMSHPKIKMEPTIRPAYKTKIDLDPSKYKRLEK